MTNAFEERGLSTHRERAKELLVRRCVFESVYLVSGSHVECSSCTAGVCVCLGLAALHAVKSSSLYRHACRRTQQASSAPLAPFLRWSAVVHALLAVTDPHSVRMHFILTLIFIMANLRAPSTSAQQNGAIKESVHVISLSVCVCVCVCMSAHVYGLDCVVYVCMQVGGQEGAGKHVQ